MPSGTAILSPHPDDAVLSLGGAIALGTLPKPLTLITVFGRSAFRADGGPDGTPELVTATRRAEDEAYAHGRGLRHVWLGFEDGALRVGWQAIFESAPAPPDVLQALNDTIEQISPSLLLAPLGLGNHVDHRIVREFGRRYTGDAAIGFYEDVPYAARYGAAAIAESVAELQRNLTEFLVPMGEFELDAKLSDLAYYESQAANWWPRAVRRCTRHGGERLWLSVDALRLVAS